MAPLPKRRQSRHRTGKRRSQIKLTKPQMVKCAHCKQLTLPHQACPHCGYYAGRFVGVRVKAEAGKGK